MFASTTLKLHELSRLQGHATNLEAQLASKEAEVVALAAEIRQPSNSSSSVLGMPEGDGLDKQEVGSFQCLNWAQCTCYLPS